jgi:succinate dehydrogenase/fumarate reductase iron-sulfur protein
MKGNEMKKGKVRVFRYDPEKDPKPRYDTYRYPFEPGMTVLDVAAHIRANIDPAFSFGYCCKNSHCGLCSAKINGRPGLMCREPATPQLTLEPLDEQAVVRDLLMDWDLQDAGLVNLRLFLDRVDAPKSLPEWVSRDDHDCFKVMSRCVRCYCCVSVCPAHRELAHGFLGPAAVVQMARHAFDPRDQLNRAVLAHGIGIDRCILCGSCQEVCPHGISPEWAVRSLRGRLGQDFPGATRGNSGRNEIHTEPKPKRSGRISRENG